MLPNNGQYHGNLDQHQVSHLMNANLGQGNGKVPLHGYGVTAVFGKDFSEQQQAVSVTNCPEKTLRIKQEPNPTNNKSPMSILHELCALQKVTPQYEVVQQEVPGSPQYYQFNCKVSALLKNQMFEGTGSGKNKKEAKHEAAKALLNNLTHGVGFSNGDTVDGSRGHQQCSWTSESLKEAKEPAGQTTPVSFLNEVCYRAKITPVYVFTERGPVHDRLYDCTITVEADDQNPPVFAAGSGRAKKDAKQEAAKNLLHALFPHMSERLKLQFPKSESQAQVSCDPEVPGNPIGELNEYCLKATKVLPEYVEEEAEGYPHLRIFTLTCKLGPKICERGRGRSKKHAKRVAAYKMLLRLKDKNETDTNAVDEIDSSIQERLNKLTLGSERPQKHSLHHVIHACKERQGTMIELIRNEGEVHFDDPVTLITAVADEQNWNLDWVDMKDPVDEESFNILSFGSDPKLIFFGRGDGRTDCRKNAAENALLFLRAAPVN